MEKGSILVTGVAGFVGLHAAARLLSEGRRVIGLDHPAAENEPLRRARLERNQGKPGFSLDRIDVADEQSLTGLFERTRPESVLHLAAQAGVRRSIDEPRPYVESNLLGFANVLEACRRFGVKHLVYASSSSVYGSRIDAPFSERDPVDHPISFYAATKRCNELMAHAYSHIHALPTTGLRFFTVYGPWGRPDMAVFLFTKALFEGRPIDVFDRGELLRDFTYIDDVVEALSRMIDKPAAASNDESPDRSRAPFRLYNVGNSRPTKVLDVIAALERATGRKADLRFKAMQPGDVPLTAADCSETERDFGFRPDTPIETGLARFVDWYRSHHAIA